MPRPLEFYTQNRRGKSLLPGEKVSWAFAHDGCGAVGTPGEALASLLEGGGTGCAGDGGSVHA